ncbi:SWIM zinc finger family protein [Streptomyces sp. NPDC006367]|uniref:SWIM zinc finger family protein n=1 Tax=unclassified Streptomyces TaxID=2593676 RepID=UPI0033BB60F6
MTPHPADEARRALRAARQRGDTAPGPDDTRTDVHAHAGAAHTAPRTGGTEREPARRHGQEHGGVRERDREPQKEADHEAHTGPRRPGDIARAALRSARTADTATAAAPAADGMPDPASGPGSAATSEATEAAEPTEPTDEKTDEATGEKPCASASPSPAGAAPAPRSEPGSGNTGRPADVAREALRAARRQAQAQARSDSAANGPARTRLPSRPARGPQGAGGPPTADARARALRDFVAGAFRLPPEVDPAEDAPTSGEPVGALHDEHAPAPSHEPPLPSAERQAEQQAERQAERQQAAARPEHAPVTHGRDSAPPPASPRAPRSMAAPDRDGDLRRTFPALPPRTASGDGFAETWWGNAWVTALEEGALDPKRLARGRGYAEQGHVDAITVTPGLVLVYVQGSRPRPYRVQVRLRTLDDAGWDRFLDAAADRPGHIAALLDRELPHSLADCGVPLLPGPGDLVPQCSCPDTGHPCKHAAALCYQTARLLDADPFVLLLLRGRGERDLLDALSRLSAARAARAAQDRDPAPLPGVRATEALAARSLPPLPPPLPAPPHPEQPPAYPAAPGGPDPFALDQLATDAAARAHALLTTGRDPVGGLTLWQDAVRLAAARPGSGLTAATRTLYSSLARAAGRSTSELARAVAAWRQGGHEGLAVLEEPWDPPAGRFDRARPALLAADLPAFRPWRNRLTHPAGHLQLRLGRTGLWYAYESEPGHDDWWPRGTPDLDPVGALTGLAGPEALGGL